LSAARLVCGKSAGEKGRACFKGLAEDSQPSIQSDPIQAVGRPHDSKAKTTKGEVEGKLMTKKVILILAALLALLPAPGCLPF
jgi:hypothetical protein